MEEIDLKDIIKILWNKKNIVIAVTLLFLIVSFLIFASTNNIFKNIQAANNTENLYYTETHFIVGTAETMTMSLEHPTSDNSISASLSEKTRVVQTDILFQTYSEIIKSKSALERIIQELNLDIDFKNLSNQISFSKVSDSDLLSLVVAYNDNELVVKISEKILDEFVNNISKAYAIDQVAIIDEPYLLSNTNLPSSAAGIMTSSTIAKIALKNTVNYTILLTILGFILSVVIVLVIEMFDDTIKNENDLKNLLPINILTTINKKKSNNDDKFAILKIRLLEFKKFLVTSSDLVTDTTYISNNLAASFAKSKKVLLLDLNSNRSNLVEKYNGKGLLNYINSNSKTKNINKFISKSTVENLDILLIGTNSTNIYFEEDQLKAILKTLETTYDTIIINSPDVLDEANTLATIKAIKDLVLITTERKTKLEEFNKTQTIVKELKGNIIDDILVKE